MSLSPEGLQAAAGAGGAEREPEGGDTGGEAAEGKPGCGDTAGECAEEDANAANTGAPNGAEPAEPDEIAGAEMPEEA